MNHDFWCVIPAALFVPTMIYYHTPCLMWGQSVEDVLPDLFWTQSKHNVFFSFFSLSFSVCLFFHSTLKTMWLALLTYHFTTLLLAHGQNACTGHSTFRAPGQRHQSVPIVIVCALVLFSTCWIYIFVSEGKLSFCCYVPYFLDLLMIFGCFLTSKVFWMLKAHGSYLIIKSYLE